MSTHTSLTKTILSLGSHSLGQAAALSDQGSSRKLHEP